MSAVITTNLPALRAVEGHSGGHGLGRESALQSPAGNQAKKRNPSVLKGNVAGRSCPWLAMLCGRGDVGRKARRAAHGAKADKPKGSQSAGTLQELR